MTGYIEPNNQVVVKAVSTTERMPLEVAGTVTNMKPGRLVKRGADDYKVIINGAGEAGIGFLDFEGTFGPDRPADIDTAYAAGDWASVVYGPGTILVAYGNEAITKGARLAAGANGGLIVADSLVVNSGAATASAVDATTPTISGSVGDGGIVVAIAEETITEAGKIIIRSLI